MVAAVATAADKRTTAKLSRPSCAAIPWLRLGDLRRRRFFARGARACARMREREKPRQRLPQSRQQRRPARRALQQIPPKTRTFRFYPSLSRAARTHTHRRVLPSPFLIGNRFGNHDQRRPNCLLCLGYTAVAPLFRPTSLHRSRNPGSTAGPRPPCFCVAPNASPPLSVRAAWCTGELA